MRFEVIEIFDIIIENSGEISDETLQSLNEKLQSTDMQMETTAIININRRLKLYLEIKVDCWLGVGTWRIKGNCTCIYRGETS